MKLNLGCDIDYIPGYVNIDHRPGVGDLCEDVFTLPTFAPNTAAEIIASHILEHAMADRVVDILGRWRSVLRPGGALWVAVPDFSQVLGKHYEQYQNGEISWEFFNSRIFGNYRVAREMYGEEAIPGFPGYRGCDLAFHRSVFTADMLVEKMCEAGFYGYSLEGGLPHRRKSGKEICVRATK